ncbi:MAG: hypothetical protein GKR88_13110 [Flavobacteriaceae bacterium]|nr:MAG: hypothetical protein GKR88_13110 [Flavobacteriaceae bacterium]
MKKTVFFSFVIFSFLSCKNDQGYKKNNPFLHGVFEIPAGENYSKTIVTRKDSIQIEEYTKFMTITTDSTLVKKTVKRIDTLYITWKNNFSYTLKMKSPKTALDKDPIYVRITKVTDSSYHFSAKIGFSKFKQEGIVYKVKQ